MRSHIIIVSPSYGGAEKRFFDIFTALRRHGDDVALIAPSSLVDRLRSDHPERADELMAVIGVPLPTWSGIGFMRGFRDLLKTLPRGGHYHYPLNCLWMLHLGRSDRVTMSVVDCTSVPGPFSGKRTSVWAWVAFPFVDRIDVLSPAIRHALARSQRTGRMSLTPGGTYVVAPPASLVPKAPAVVFLGRLVAGKGLDELFDVLPRTWEHLRPQIPSGFELQIAGYGPLESHVVRRVATLASQGLPVRFVGHGEADALLAPAAVALSMQEPTNYPSRVVAEALMAGCGVLIRDTGDSRQFGDLSGLAYCKAVLDPEEMATKLNELVRTVLADAGFRQRIRQSAIDRFATTAYIEYFHDLFYDDNSFEPDGRTRGSRL